MVARCLAAPDPSSEPMSEVLCGLSSEAADYWRGFISHWHTQLQSGLDCGLPVAASAEATMARAEQIVRQLPSRKRAASATWQEVIAGSALATSQQSNKRGKQKQKRQRTAKVGRRKPPHPDCTDERTVANEAGQAIAEWHPPRNAGRRPLTEVIPVRSAPYQPTDWQQVDQLAAVRSWRTERLLQHLRVDDAYFAIGGMTTAVRMWRARPGNKGRRPPVEVLAKACCTDLLLALTTAETGHMWSIRVLGPFDARQLAAAADMPELAGALQELLDQGLTESKLRALVGQATIKAQVRVNVDRMLQRVTQRTTCEGRVRREWGKGGGMTVGSIGTGMGLTAIQVADAVGGRVEWCAEACATAQAAGGQMMLMTGHEPEWFDQAEQPELASPKRSMAIEANSLCCAPFSPAGNKSGVERAMREFRNVLEGVAARQSKVVVFENTDGLWDEPEWRARVEQMLVRVTNYEWESMMVSPHLHGGVPLMRKRVFYTGVRRDMVRAQGEGARAAGDGTTTGEIAAPEAMEGDAGCNDAGTRGSAQTHEEDMDEREVNEVGAKRRRRAMTERVLHQMMAEDNYCFAGMGLLYNDYTHANYRCTTDTSASVGAARVAGDQVHDWTISPPLQPYEMEEAGVEGVSTDVATVMANLGGAAHVTYTDAAREQGREGRARWREEQRRPAARARAREREADARARAQRTQQALRRGLRPEQIPRLLSGRAIEAAQVAVGSAAAVRDAEEARHGFEMAVAEIRRMRSERRHASATWVKEALKRLDKGGRRLERSEIPQPDHAIYVTIPINRRHVPKGGNM